MYDCIKGVLSEIIQWNCPQFPSNLIFWDFCYCHTCRNLHREGFWKISFLCTQYKKHQYKIHSVGMEHWHSLNLVLVLTLQVLVAFTWLYSVRAWSHLYILTSFNWLLNVILYVDVITWLMIKCMPDKLLFVNTVQNSHSCIVPGNGFETITLFEIRVSVSQSHLLLQRCYGQDRWIRRDTQCHACTHLKNISSNNRWMTLW